MFCTDAKSTRLILTIRVEHLLFCSPYTKYIRNVFMIELKLHPKSCLTCHNRNIFTASVSSSSSISNLSYFSKQRALWLLKSDLAFCKICISHSKVLFSSLRLVLFVSGHCSDCHFQSGHKFPNSIILKKRVLSFISISTSSCTAIYICISRWLLQVWLITLSLLGLLVAFVNKVWLACFGQYCKPFCMVAWRNAK